LDFPFLFYLATTQGERSWGAGRRSAWSRAEARPVRLGNLREARGEGAVHGGLKTWESRCPVFFIGFQNTHAKERKGSHGMSRDTPCPSWRAGTARGKKGRRVVAAAVGRTKKN
jgi:hypothetical protein